MPSSVATANLSRRRDTADRPGRTDHAGIAAGWNVPAWVHQGTGRWTPCNALARAMHAGQTAEVDAALRDAGVVFRGAGAAATESTAVTATSTAPGDSGRSVRFLLLPLHDGAGRPTGMLVTADAEGAGPAR